MTTATLYSLQTRPDVDGDGEAGVVGAESLADDAEDEAGGSEDALLVQNSGQSQTGLSRPGLHGHGEVLVPGQPQADVLPHHPDSADLPDHGVDGEVLPDEEADGGPAALQETSLVRLGERE